ncbi:MAG: hypothetical protein IH986_10110 [Planctomycetes bacterium]|nr:hypothetical protein [Planctomycetota bacterium]
MKYLLLIAAIVVVLAFIVVVARRRNDSAKTEADSSPTSGAVNFVDPSQVMYTLPTICDRLAPVEAPTDTPTKGDLILHEDDWRQIEFVPLADSGYISSQLGELRQFKIDHKIGFGFSSIFVRPDHPTAFGKLSLRLTDLSSALGVGSGNLFISEPTIFPPIGSVGHVSGGFSFRIDDNFNIYGFHRDGSVQSLGITIDVYEAGSPDIDKVSTALRKIRNLVEVNIVDWYQGTMVAPDSLSEIKAWLQR